MTRIEKVIKHIQSKITQGTWMPGVKIWSIRHAATSLNVSKNTVTEAYDRLVAMGWLIPKRGSGYYVPIKKLSNQLPKAASVAQTVDSASLLREQLIHNYEVRVGEGRPPLMWVNAYDNKVTNKVNYPFLDNNAHGYSNPWGYEGLRKYLASNLQKRGVNVDIENILTTMGANHAFDLIIRQYLEPGDTVLVDSPGYYPLFAKLHFMGVKIIGVKRDLDGPNIQELQDKASKHKPKMFFTQSQGHNPTGAGLNVAVGHRVLKEAEKHNFLIVEDDPFSDLLPEHLPRLIHLDQFERVIYIGTFSKTLSAGLRVGYLAASKKRTQALCDLKMLTIASSSGVTEQMLYEFINAGEYSAYLKRLKNKVQQATKSAITAMQGLNLEVFCEPVCSFYIWVFLPEHENEMQLVEAASNKNIFIAPGYLFIPEKQSRKPAMRINVAYADDPRFIDFMKTRLRG